jgi:predicted GNAT family acetyltransferase
LSRHAVIGDHRRVPLTVTHDSVEVSARAGTFLAARIHRNILATVLADVLDGRHAEPAPLFGVATSDRGEVIAVAVRTPPWPMLATGFDAHAAELLIERWLPADAGLPGVSGEPATARAVAGAWERRCGGTARRRVEMAMHQLSAVVGPQRRARGALRLAQERDRTTLEQWEDAFAAEAHLPIDDAAAIVASRLTQQRQFVWEHDGAVCTVAASRRIGGIVRLGPVYTPPEHRRRGYAASAVADVCHAALADGARECMLFTDLSNPTSNRVYAAVGFRRFADWEEHEFTRP